jgi:hypothetical protein
MSGNTMSALVYDIGLHDGRDTGHYLREGCRVVALDANPVMCAAAEANFRDYIQTGQLTVINCGVAEHEGNSNSGCVTTCRSGVRSIGT